MIGIRKDCEMVLTSGDKICIMKSPKTNSHTLQAYSHHFVTKAHVRKYLYNLIFSSAYISNQPHIL